MIAFGTVLASSADGTKADAASEREMIVFEGIRIVFPKGEADVALALKPALHEYLRKRQPMADEEAEAFANIVSGTIASADRRWFCDGMANWIAIREVDRRFGASKGAEAFAKNYHAEELKEHAGEVNLLAWPAQEEIDNGSRPQVGNVAAHYYFATLVIEKACEGQGGGFVKRWLEEIRRTPPESHEQRHGDDRISKAHREESDGDHGQHRTPWGACRDRRRAGPGGNERRR